MYEQKPNIEPLNWVTAVTGEARHHRANIVMWRNSAYLLWDLLARSSAISLQSDAASANEPMRILTSRRQVMSELASLHARVVEWCASLHATDLDCSTLDAILEARKLGLERVIEWEVAVRFGGITQDPDSMLATYEMLGEVTHADLNAVANALAEVGKEAEQVALKAGG